MTDSPALLGGLLALLFVLSAFFSGSETALMALNRYRLRHRAEQGHYGARAARALLERPDRLIGLILFGNNLVNILITQLATYLGYVHFGELGVAVATGLLTIAILVFAEVAPKTLGALHAERVALPAAVVYRPLLALAWPLVWLINRFANGLLRLLGMPKEERRDALTREELRGAVRASSRLLPERHRRMLLGILDLEKVRVEDIMVPRGEIAGIDLGDDWSEVVDQLRRPSFTRLPVFDGGMDNVAGFLHLRKILPQLLSEELSPAGIREAMREPCFIPAGTSLSRQLFEFQRQKRRLGLVIDEYGDIQGLVTLEDILEEIVGTFTGEAAPEAGVYRRHADGSAVVDASAGVRQLNALLGIRLHEDGPRTLNGLILEHMEDIPDAGTSMLIDRYPVEVVQTGGTAVRKARIYPRQEPPAAAAAGAEA